LYNEQHTPKAETLTMLTANQCVKAVRTVGSVDRMFPSQSSQKHCRTTPAGFKKNSNENGFDACWQKRFHRFFL